MLGVYTPWRPLDVPTLTRAMRDMTGIWCVRGGVALDLLVDRQWREHGDIDACMD